MLHSIGGSLRETSVWHRCISCTTKVSGVSRLPRGVQLVHGIKSRTPPRMSMMMMIQSEPAIRYYLLYILRYACCIPVLGAAKPNPRQRLYEYGFRSLSVSEPFQGNSGYSKLNYLIGWQKIKVKKN